MADKTNKPSKDRVKGYLTPRLRDYIFDELSEAYLKKADLLSVMRGVPVPFDRGDLSGRQTTTVKLASNMAYVIGCDPEFDYAENYLACIYHLFSTEFAKPLRQQGIDAAQKEDFETACIFFRAAKEVDPDLEDIWFLYGRACFDAYNKGKSDAYVGAFRREALHAFEQATIAEPEKDQAYYYLGFMYLNLGMYLKSKLTFQTFLKLSGNSKEGAELRAEVLGYLDKMDDPVRIEEGVNAVLSCRFESGIEILSAYTSDDRFNKWWPLWYYLGTAHHALEKKYGQAYAAGQGTGDSIQAVSEESQMAEAALRTGLQYAPSSQEIMQELVAIYTERGDQEMVTKYRNKIARVQENAELDREEVRKKNGVDAS